MHKKTFIVDTPDEFTTISKYITALPMPCNRAQLITLSGDLGSGKTTFTQYFARELCVTDTVVSPTFVVMKSYEVPDNPKYDHLVHIDAYRFEHESEALPLGMPELFEQPRTIVCLEWPERISELLPDSNIAVSIEIPEGEQRLVTVTHG